MGYKHQFLPANIRPLEALVPADAYVDRSQPDNRLKVAGYACTVLENDVFENPKKPFGYLTEALDQLKPGEVYIATGAIILPVGRAFDCYGKSERSSRRGIGRLQRDTPQVMGQNFPVFCTQCWAQDSSVRTYVCDYRCTIEIGR